MSDMSLSPVWHFANSIDYSPLGSSVHGILQARILEWVAISFSQGSSRLRDGTQVSCIAGRFFTIWATREAKIILTPQANWQICWGNMQRDPAYHLHAVQRSLWPQVNPRLGGRPRSPSCSPAAWHSPFLQLSPPIALHPWELCYRWWEIAVCAPQLQRT